MFSIIKKAIMLNFFILGIYSVESHANQNLPGFAKNEVLHFGPATTRLVCTWDGFPKSCGGVERHTNFEISFLQPRSLKWKAVGEILIQSKGVHSYDFDQFGKHVRLRSIDIDYSDRKRGIGTQALLTLLTFYELKGGFDCFKLEATDYEPHLVKWYRKLGFFKRDKPIEGASDVHAYTKAILPLSENENSREVQKNPK